MNRPVNKFRFNRKFFRGGNGGFHLIPRLNPDIGADPFLKSGKYEISKQQKAFSGFQHFDNIKFLPPLFIGKRFVSLFIQFDAHAIGLFIVNTLFNITDAFL